jgi:dTDP-4-amino-4,6-dideoxygalactose transaminase
MTFRKTFLVFGKPDIGDDEINEVVATLKSGWIGTGPKVERFENDFKKYIGCKHALSVNSCTAGTHLALKALDIGLGDEVITTPLTFCSTANAIIHAGATPVFADVKIDSWNIDPSEIEKKITPKTKAIIPVHLHGRPCEMNKIMALAHKRKLFVIEDAAHAVEAKYRNKKIGNIADITVFSFYVTKNLTTAEGGMVTTNNDSWAKKIKIMSLHGLSRDAYKRYNIKVFKHYQTVTPGYKYNLTDIQASIGIHQLKKIEKNVLIRKKYWQIYDQAFKKIEEIITPLPDEPHIFHARHLYAILIRPEKLKINRDQFISQLIEYNIGSGIHFDPVHLHPYYQKTYHYQKGDFPNAEFIGDRTISLPLAANLAEDDINDVIKTVKYLINKHKNSTT